ncbi:MAG: hypothetical protein MUF14_02585 [Hyphomonadaceae bacterium]|nr:hypothetical protein [Hyphomonadaceae bacterium]
MSRVETRCVRDGVASLPRWSLLAAMLVAMLAALLVSPAHAQQRRAPAAAASTPMDALAARLGLVASPSNRLTAASVRTTGNTRTWSNLRLSNEEGVVTTITTVTLEALDPVVSATSRFRLEMVGLSDTGGSVAKVELVGALAGTGGSVPQSDLLELGSYKGFVGTVAVTGLESRDGDDRITVARFEAAFVPGGPDGGRLSGMSLGDIQLKTTLDRPSEVAADASAEPATEAPADPTPLEVRIAGFTLAGLNEQAAALLASSGNDDSLGLDIDLDGKEAMAAARLAAFETFEIRGVQFTSGGASGELGRFLISGADPQRVALVEFTDLVGRYKEPSPEEGSFLGASEIVFRTGRVAVLGIKTQAMLTAGEALGGDEEARALPVSRDFTGGPMDGIFETFEINAVSLGLADHAISLDRMAYQISREADGFVTATTLLPMTLKLVLGESSDAIPQLQQARSMMVAVLGEPEFRLKLGGTTLLDRTTGIMTGRDTMITIQDAFDIGLDWAVGGMPEAMAAMTYKEWLGLSALEAEMDSAEAAVAAAAEAAASDQEAIDAASEAVDSAAAAAAAAAAAEAVAGDDLTAGDDAQFDGSVGDVMARSNPWTQLREGSPSVFEHVTIRSARFVIADRGLLERVFTGVAALSGETAASMRNSLAQTLEGSAGEQEWQDMRRKAARFIRDGGMLSIAYAPAQPLPLRDLETPGVFRSTDVRTVWRDPRAK